MSNLIIKGMEMPKDCAECPIRNQEFYKHGRAFLGCSLCVKWGSAISRAEDCPLAAIPTPHGRLIDADRLYETIEQMEGFGTIDNENDVVLSAVEVLTAIDEAPTIIEAEE